MDNESQVIIKEDDPHHTINFHLDRLHNNMVIVDCAETILTTCISYGRNIHIDATSEVMSSPKKAKLY